MFVTRHGFSGMYTCEGYIENKAVSTLARRVMIQGGSLSGRCFCLKRVAKRLTEAGFEYDTLHSPLDTDRIDAIVAPRVGLALCIGGTAPDGQFVLDNHDYAELSISEKRAIDSILKETKIYKNRACKYMEAADKLRGDAFMEYKEYLNADKLNHMLEPWLKSITAFRDSQATEAAPPFLSEAVTSKGVVRYLDSIAVPRIWRVSLPWGFDPTDIIMKLKDAALTHGVSVQCVCDCVNPSKITHMLMRELGLFITTQESAGALSEAAERTLDVRLAMPCAETMTASSIRAMAFDELTYELLIERASQNLALAAKEEAKIDAILEAHSDICEQSRMESAAIEVVNEALAQLQMV